MRNKDTHSVLTIRRDRAILKCGCAGARNEHAHRECPKTL